VTPFEFLSVALSFVIGLGITYLLTSVLSLVQERRNCRPDWLPLVWAFYVFAYQVQYWWAVFELSEVREWSLTLFLALLSYAVLLFAAGGLILPHDAARHDEGLRAYFERDGRIGVLLLNLYFLIAPIFNDRLFATPLTDPLRGHGFVRVLVLSSAVPPSAGGAHDPLGHRGGGPLLLDVTYGLLTTGWHGCLTRLCC